MNLFTDIRSLVLDAVERLAREGRLPEGLSTDAIAVEPPRDPGHGDMATNAAMVLAKPAGQNPRVIAEALAEQLIPINIILRIKAIRSGAASLSKIDSLIIFSTNARRCSSVSS